MTLVSIIILSAFFLRKKKLEDLTENEADINSFNTDYSIILISNPLHNVEIESDPFAEDFDEIAIS